MPNNNCENRLLSLLSAQEWHLDRLYGEYSKELGSLFRNQKGAVSKMQQAQLDKVMLSFNSDLEKTISQQIGNSFSISDACNDDLAKKYLKGMEVKDSQLNKILGKNPDAAASFIARKTAGLNLSDRVWNITGQTKEQLENVLEQGIFNGRPAAEMARDLKGYLKEPNRQFRRVRDADGKLILSNPAKNYHPGQGVYRSSYKNALRVSRNEINIAYRTNDFERRKDMPFVMGQKVRLSAAHPEYDICDELVGTYPKNFLFTGWHPNCLCITEALLLPREKMKEYLGGAPIDNRHLINNIPKGAQDYLNANAETLKGYKNKPYFLKDNFKNTKEGFAIKAGI